MTSPSVDRRFGLNSSIAIKAPCRVAATSNLTLSGQQTIDGVSCVTGDRVLAPVQTNSVQNGIYVVDTGSWQRATDFDDSRDVSKGTIGLITEGSYQDQFWMVTTSGTIRPGTTAISFAVGIPSISILALSSGSSLFGFLQSGTGAVARTGQAKLRDQVSVKDFGAVGDGVVDDTTAIQNAINYAATGNAKTVYFPNGVYLCTSSLKIPNTGSGVALEGESSSGCYIRTLSGTYDLLKVAASYSKVSNLLFRPGGNQLCMRVYAAHCTIEGNRFLAATDGVGTGILLTDTDPDTAASVTGAYTHTIFNNIIGVSGFAFANGIDDSSASGLQACKFIANQILASTPIRMTKGGANVYRDNLLQSVSAGAGNGIDLGANVNGEKLAGNYFEGFAIGVILRNLSNANQVAHVVGNHFDNCTAKLSSLGTANYVFENDAGTMYTSGWTTDYTSTSVVRVKTPSGAEAYAADSSAHFLVNATSGSYHTVNTTGAVQADVLLGINGAGTNAAYVQHATGTAANGANTGLAIKANSVTSRSINAGGTVNTSGADYAEYMLKAAGCGAIAKGQIVGIDVDGNLTERWAAALTFATKSTNPSYVGGDTWATHLGERPTDPDEIAAFEIALEAVRRNVDRIAFAGQVPVNVYGAQSGQYIVPVQDGDGIKGIAKDEADMTLIEYMRAIGKVIAIEADGRARIIVKVA